MPVCTLTVHAVGFDLDGVLVDSTAAVEGIGGPSPRVTGWIRSTC